MTNDYGNFELHTVLLNAMKDIDKICRENGLKYYLYAGSLLGALNYQGFIPWDDDVDIVMFQEDYIKLYAILQNEYLNLYNIITFENTLNWYSKMSKIQIEGTRIVTNQGKVYPVSIDISVLHSIPDNKIKRFIQRRQIEFLNLTLAVLSGEIIPTSWKTKLTVKQYAKLGKEYLGKKLDAVMKRYDKKNTKYVGIMCNTLTPNPYTGTSGYENDITERKMHENPIDIVFEDSMFMTISDPIIDLDRRYGKNWSKPYPEEKRITKHDVKSYFIDQEVRERVGL